MDTSRHMVAAALGPQSFVYPALARQVLQDYNIRQGRCLDAGAGPGLLSVELASRSDLRCTTLDANPDMLAAQRALVRENGLDDHIAPVLGDVHALPFPDHAFPLVVSRGSIIFWHNPARALAELGRVLAPGGVLLVGGGHGRLWPPGLRDKYKKCRFLLTHALRRRFTPKWKARMRSREEWADIVAASGLPGARLLGYQLWIEYVKP